MAKKLSEKAVYEILKAGLNSIWNEGSNSSEVYELINNFHKNGKEFTKKVNIIIND